MINQDAKLKEICSSLLEEVKTEIRKEVKIHKLRLKSSTQTKLCLKSKLKNSKKLVATKNQDKNDKLEQYGHQLCLRIDRVPVDKGETSEGALKNVTDRENCIGNEYVDISKKIRWRCYRC